MQVVKHGVVVGNGAALNISLGWIPDSVELYNATDGDLLTVGYLRKQVIPFTSGGVIEVVPGDTIVGATSRARAIVEQVELYSGTWAAGDAAGFFVVDTDTIEGTFSGENIYVSRSGTINDATVTANVVHNYASAAAITGATGTSALSIFQGTSALSPKGFTIGSVIAEEAKILRWRAFRDGPGGS